MSSNKIAWVIDSSAYINEFLRSHPDVYIVPINIHFGQEQFIDGVDLTSEELYDRIRTGKDPVKTSQPSAGVFAQLYYELKDSYEKIIAIHVSNSLSGTIAASVAGAHIAQASVDFIDSLSLSAGITCLVEEGLWLQQQDTPYENILTLLKKKATMFRNYILIGNLTQLYKGGRLSSAQFYLGSLLKIKPIIQINQNGELQELDKVRSYKKAVLYLIQKAISAVDDGVSTIYIMHAHAIEQANFIKEAVQKERPDASITIGEISTSLAVHAGEETLAVLWHLPF